MRRTISFRYLLTLLLFVCIGPSVFGHVSNDFASGDYPPATLTVNTQITESSCETGISTVCYFVVGGAEPYTAVCQDSNGQLYNASGTCFENLPPGTYTITVTDSGSETGSTTFEIDTPLTVLINTVTPASCNGMCDGSVELTVNGGEGDVNFIIEGIIYSYPEDFSSFCAGSYSGFALDENSCSFDFDFEILEPDPIETSISTSVATCTGMFDGTASMIPSGGIAPLIVEYEDDNLDFEAMQAGEYPFTVTDNEGCVLYDTIVVEAAIQSDFRLEVFSTPVSCWNEKDGTATALITGGQEPISILWNDDLQQTTEIAVGLTNHQYTVTVSDALGCEFTRNVNVDLTAGCLFIADALSPNGDGYNDTWVIGGLEFFPQAQVNVYNRWGQLVFESTGYHIDWDGTFAGEPLPIADYFYVITNSGTEEPIIGTVTIKY